MKDAYQLAPHSNVPCCSEKFKEKWAVHRIAPSIKPSHSLLCGLVSRPNSSLDGGWILWLPDLAASHCAHKSHQTQRPSLLCFCPSPSDAASCPSVFPRKVIQHHGITTWLIHASGSGRDFCSTQDSRRERWSIDTAISQSPETGHSVGGLSVSQNKYSRWYALLMACIGKGASHDLRGDIKNFRIKIDAHCQVQNHSPNRKDILNEWFISERP